MTFKKALTIYLLAILLSITTTLLIRFIEYGTAIDTIIEIGLNGETIPETNLTNIFFSFSTFMIGLLLFITYASLIYIFYLIINHKKKETEA